MMDAHPPDPTGMMPDEALQYAHKHRLEERLSQAVNAILLERPADPGARLVELLSAELVTAAVPEAVPEAAALDPMAAVPEAVPEAAASDPSDPNEWSVTAWVASLGLGSVLADAVSPPAGGAQAPVDYVKNLTRQRIVAMLRSSRVEDKLADILIEGARKLLTQAAATSAALNAKFAAEASFEMAYGGVELFYSGLDGLLGSPLLVDGSFKTAMEREHTKGDDATEEFTSSNGMTTTSLREWEFVIAPKEGAEYPERRGFRDAHPESCRKLAPLGAFAPALAERNAALAAAGHATIIEEEIIAGRLYTGPLYEKYNTVLRAKSGNTFLVAKCASLCRGNEYATTIHAINSCVIKGSKLMKAVKVYRGFTGAKLPSSFWERDAFNCRGGVEFGFSSTTVERAQAEHYATGRASTLFEMDMGLVDKGCDLSWLSQYPHEREVLFPPLTGIEVLGSSVDGSSLIIATRLALNLASLTLDEQLAKRRKVVLDMCRVMNDSLKHELASSAAWAQIQNVFGDVDVDGEAKARLREWLDEIGAAGADVFNLDANLGAAIQACCSTKAVVTGWPRGFERLCAAAGVEEVGALFDRPKLSLGMAGLADPEVGALALVLRTQRPAELRQLDLLGNDISVRAATHLADVVLASTARGALSMVGDDFDRPHAFLHGRGFGDADLVLLGASLRLRAPTPTFRLRSLELYGNRLGASVDVFGNRLGASLGCLGRAAGALVQLEGLHLDANAIDDEDIAAFCDALPSGDALPALQVLGLSGNFLREITPLAAAAEAGALAALRRIYLGHNQLEDASAAARLTSACLQLGTVDLQQNPLATLPEGAAAALRARGGAPAAAHALSRFAQPGGGENAPATAGKKIGLVGIDFEPTGQANGACFGYELVYVRVPGLTFEALHSGQMAPDVEIVFQGCVRSLEVQGCSLISGEVSLLNVFEASARRVASVPTCMSAMKQAPAVDAALPAGEKVLVLTFEPDMLRQACAGHVELNSERFLVVSAADIPGLEAVAMGEELDLDLVTPGVLAWARHFMERQPAITVLMVEETSLLPLADRLRANLRIPVLDTTTIPSFIEAGDLRV